MGDENIKKISEIPDEKIFRCKTCTTEQEEKWLTWNQVEKQNIDGQRFGLFCPDCKNDIGIYDKDQEVDTTKIKKSPF